jgi:predicted HNH restriction endonuclease
MKKLPITPNGKIVVALRQLWLRSRERALALKLNNYSCNKCKVKQSRAKGKEQKIEVHHKEGVGNWDKIIKLIREELLCSPDKLECLCPECHEEITDEQRQYQHQPYQPPPTHQPKSI